MGTTLRSKFTLLFIAFAVAMFIFPAMAFAEVISSDGTTASSPTIQSDKADYAPGELVTLAVCRRDEIVRGTAPAARLQP